MNGERGCTGGMIIAFLVGGLVGAGLALLYAPVSGREAREKIGDLAGDLRKKTENLATNIREKVETFVKEEKEAMKAAYEAGREAIDKEKARFAKAD